ncbi:MAG: SCP2 sterol-binding domain-containing protein [Candidatus Hodarchaeales archaeon]|jgi:putative sterol carrier protein
MSSNDKKIYFPSEEWLEEYAKKINENPEYAKAAATWEGDFLWIMEPDGTEPEEFRDQTITTYLDLWHGKCRKAFQVTPETGTPDTEFVVTGKYSTWVSIMKGELDSVKALMTRKLKIKGNMAKALRATKATKELDRSAKMIENVEFL